MQTQLAASSFFRQNRNNRTTILPIGVAQTNNPPVRGVNLGTCPVFFRSA